MNNTTTRVPVDLLQNVFDHLFHANTTLSKIRDAVLADRLLDYSPDSIAAPGRSLAWKIFLVPREPLDSELNSSMLLDSLREARKQYRDALLEKLRAPDGSYEEGFTIPGSSALPERRPEKADLNRNNPLSLHVENPWVEWFAAVELRKTIHQDVERTFPDLDFFRNLEVQNQLTNILFLYSVSNPSIGYRQGMHELLAPLFYAVDYDSLPEDTEEPNDHTFREIFSKAWVAADAWALFEAVMRRASRWYEWREPVTASDGAATPLSTHFHLNVPIDQVEIRPYITPIVQDANHIQSNLLRSTDPALWKHMQSTGIEPQIYGIRWLRLLFTREFSMPDAMKLWDSLFATDPTFALAPWICVAMLIRIRNHLLPTDYTGQLTVLLRYPSPTNVDSPTHHITLLLKQALALQLSPTPSTSTSLMKENQLLLQIPLDVPEPPPPTQRRLSTPTAREKSSSSSNRGSSVDKAHNRQPSHPMGFPEMLTRGLMEKGESLGINKTLMSAVSELRRNIPELASSFVRSPSASYPILPLTDERPHEERPPWEPRSRLEMEHEISSLKTLNKRLGESLTWIVDVLLQDESQTSDLQKLQRQKREVVESLSYVRDVLITGVGEIEEDRLFGEEELARRALAEERKKTIPQETLTLNIPQPVRALPQDSRPAMRVPRKQISTASPSASPSSSFSETNVSRFAPWSYTKSNFSGDSSHLPATSLPRLPPPTSTADLRRPAAISGTPTVREIPTIYSPTAKSVQPAQDPLGVVR